MIEEAKKRDSTWNLRLPWINKANDESYEEDDAGGFVKLFQPKFKTSK